jgi:hypothetical protein
MPVPLSIPVIDDASWSSPPQVPFKTKKMFDHTSNILTILRGGGCLRGRLGRDGAGGFEILSKRELREEVEVKIGHGRRVSSWTVSSMIGRGEIYLPDIGGVDGEVVYAHATVDEFIVCGFPIGWGILHKPYLNASYLCRKTEGDTLFVAERPKKFPVTDWITFGRAMAHGLVADLDFDQPQVSELSA